jgi:L-threonylcarbamoyladenylate synthase
VIGVLPQIVGRRPGDHTPRVSGSLTAHYAPTTPLRLVAKEHLAEVIDRLHGRCAVLCHSRLPGAGVQAVRRLPDDPRGYASQLYAALRELDQAGAASIVVEEIPASPAWAAVADRLQRAACGSGAKVDRRTKTAPDRHP